MKEYFIAAKSLYDCGQAIKKVVENEKKSHSPLQIRVINSHSTTNVIEIYNLSDEELMNVRVEIFGSIREDCYWDLPNDKVLSIPFLKPKSSQVVNLLYRNSQSALAEFKCMWRNWRNNEFSQSINVQLLGWLS